MTGRFGRETWSVVVPSGWRARHDDACATLVADHPIGAVQISAAFKDSEILDADLQDFAAEHLGRGATALSRRAGAFVGFEIAFRDEAHCCRQWYLRSGRQMLFVTYNCRLEQQGVEDEVVELILDSLLANRGAPGSSSDPAAS